MLVNRRLGAERFERRLARVVALDGQLLVEGRFHLLTLQEREILRLGKRVVLSPWARDVTPLFLLVLPLFVAAAVLTLVAVDWRPVLAAWAIAFAARFWFRRRCAGLAVGTRWG